MEVFMVFKQVIKIVCLPLLISMAMPTNAKSLYDEVRFKPLTNQPVASKVGDILSVVILESTSAQAAAGTDASTDTGIGINVSDGSTDLRGVMGLGSEFDGSAKIKRTGQLMAQVSVTIKEILSNGLLKIEGEQEIKLNAENQFMKVSGFIRPTDIDESNMILSTKIYESKIELIGEGILSNSEEPGWITRFFQWLF